MLSEAVDEILKSQASEQQKLQQRTGRRDEVRRLDAWLQVIEDRLEQDQRKLPERLVKEIAAFLREQAPPLHRELLRDTSRDGAHALDVLFDAQERLRAQHQVQGTPNRQGAGPA
ncbi:MAG TPA: hypothetical protein VIA06_14400 [Candidatus Dormibacteraeota bacterium]|nr:hypothetical protein [Candidatus Dormibacteraeota bacterium]